MSVEAVLQVALGGAVLLGVAAALSAAFDDAAARHLAWAAAVVTTLLLPLLIRLPAAIPLAAAPPEPGPDVVRAALLVWVVGATVVLLAVLGEALGLRREARAARPLSRGRRARHLREAAARLGVRRVPRLLEGRSEAAPRTWGVVRPVLLVPPSSVEWSDARLSIVFVHELEHLRRADWAVQFLAAGVCALHWFDPLAWLAASRLRLERERACDAAVVRAGVAPADYAATLLDMARDLKPPRSLAPLLGPHGSQLERRLRGLLDPSSFRPLAPVRAATIVGAMGLAAGLWGAVGLVPSSTGTGAGSTAALHAVALDPSGVACDRSRSTAERLLASLDSWGDPARRHAFLDSAAGIRASRHQRRVFEALLADDELPVPDRAEVLRSAAMIDKSSELAGLLVEFARAHPPEGELRQAYLDAARAIDRDADRTRALSAVGISAARSPAT